MSEKTYHFVYKTTNLINHKIYIGKHSTNNLEDNYLGSGKYLFRAFKKYGTKNFKREVLKFFDIEQEALDYERELVNEEFILREDTYNLQIGGKGGLYGMVTVKDEFGNISKVSANDLRYLSGELVGINGGISSWSKDRIGITNGVDNKYIFIEIDKIPEGFWRGSYTKGKTGITNGVDNKFIDLETDKIPEGWREGSCRKGLTYITNGKKNKLVNLEIEEIPETWREGSCIKNTTWVTDGKVDKRIDLEIEDAPEGFWRGTTFKGLTCITNRKENKFINPNTEEIPQGFWEGTKRSKNWRLTSPNNEVFDFMGLQNFYDFCKDNNLSGNALQKNRGNFFELGTGDHRKLRKNTVGWKVDLIK